VKGVRSITADRSAGCGRVCQVEEDACIRPSLEPRKTRPSMAIGPSTFQNLRDGEEVHWVAKDGHYAMRVAPKLCQLRNTPASDMIRCGSLIFLRHSAPQYK
jgi:hypothetical protein